MKQLVDQDAKGPHISFGSVNVMNETLGTHVQRTTDTDIPEGVFGLDREPEVRYLKGMVSDENIGDFDVPVNNPLSGKVIKRLKS